MGNIELTTMCMVFDKKNNKVLVQNRVKNWKGISFPGGHIEEGEGIVDATIREVKEETGLQVSNLKSCGIIHSYNELTKERFFVFNFKTENFDGILINETDEGKVFWVDINELQFLNIAEGFKERLPMFFENKYEESFRVWDGINNCKLIKWI